MRHAIFTLLEITLSNLKKFLVFQIWWTPIKDANKFNWGTCTWFLEKKVVWFQIYLMSRKDNRIRQFWIHIAPILFCLEQIILNKGRACNHNTSPKVTSFYKLTASFDFLSSSVITSLILNLTLPVTQLLQGPAIDIADATRLIESLKFRCKRNAIDTFHKKC